MAAPSKRTAQVKNSPLAIVLKDTRLKKISVEILIPVEEAGKGSMELFFDIKTTPSEDIEDLNKYPAILKIEGKGFNKEDTSKVAFTLDAELIGIFSLSRKPSNAELKAEVSINMANVLAPVLVDTIEIAIIKGGYPRLRIPRSFPPPVIITK